MAIVIVLLFVYIILKKTKYQKKAIREQYEKSIKADRREMDEIREKLKLLRIAVQSASKED